MSAKHCLLQGFANIYFYYSVYLDEREDMRKHVIFEVLNFMENIAILIVVMGAVISIKKKSIQTVSRCL